MSFEQLANSESSSDIRPEKMREFESLQTPQELLEFMERNIEYGFISRKDQRRYTWRDKEMSEKMRTEYFLQSPQEQIMNGCGVCWDSAELAREWFSERGYDFQVYFMMFVKNKPNTLPTHSFLVFRSQDKYYWFEFSDSANRGIHEYDTLMAAVEAVKNEHLHYAITKHNAHIDDAQDLIIKAIERPALGCSAQEYIDQNLSGGSDLVDW